MSTGGGTDREREKEKSDVGRGGIWLHAESQQAQSWYRLFLPSDRALKIILEQSTVKVLLTILNSTYILRNSNMVQYTHDQNMLDTAYYKITFILFHFSTLGST